MDQAEFTDAVERYQDAVYRVALHALGSPQDADDAVQEVFLRLYTAQKTFESEEHLKHWILRVAVNESRKVLRSFWRRTSVPLEEWRDSPAPEDPAKADLFRAVMGLETKYRLTVYLYYYEGCTVAEVAAALRANPSTVQTWLLRARKQLRRELSDEEEKEGPGYVRPQIVP